MTDCKHQWVTTKASVISDDNYHPPRPVEIPVERICSLCGFIMSNFGEDTWDEGRLYHVNGYWDNIKEMRSFEEASVYWKGGEKTLWTRYCASCGERQSINRKVYCWKCGFEFKRIKEKGLGVRKKEKKKKKGEFGPGLLFGFILILVPLFIGYTISGGSILFTIILAFLWEIFWGLMSHEFDC